MGSTNEAINYGVPVICIPIQCDQPLVSHRLAELGLGKAFDYRTLTAEKLRRCIHEIFADGAYLERMLKFSKLSRQYNGSINSANLIMDLLTRSSSKKLD